MDRRQNSRNHRSQRRSRSHDDNILPNKRPKLHGLLNTTMGTSIPSKHKRRTRKQTSHNRRSQYRKNNNRNHKHNKKEPHQQMVRPTNPQNTRKQQHNPKHTQRNRNTQEKPTRKKTQNHQRNTKQNRFSVDGGSLSFIFIGFRLLTIYLPTALPSIAPDYRSCSPPVA